MRRKIFIALALILSVNIADVGAQSFLKKMKESVEKEVKTKVEQEWEKRVNGKKGKQQEQTQTEQKQDSKSSSSQASSQEQKAKKTTSVGSNGPVTGKVNGHEWVDLGLPSGTRWATCNVDATSPEKPGKHYAWGETVTKASYTEATSKFYQKSASDISGKANDVATLKWGEAWRTPTKKEFEELLDYCDWKYVQKNGRWGVQLTSIKNKQSIFLPATGSMDGTKLDEPNGCGMYWTSTPYNERGNCCSHEYHFGAALGEMGFSVRYYGYAIRPVLK